MNPHPANDSGRTIQDGASFEETRQTLALLELLALGARDIEARRTRPARAVIDELRYR